MWSTVRFGGQKESFARLSHVDAEGAYAFVAKLTMSLGIKIAAALFIMAVLDYIYQKYEHEKSLKMSKQDIKDEYKKRWRATPSSKARSGNVNAEWLCSG
ncbi:EscU/YscU/HrcU family type III secretion system export apparatus switch protein [Paenibacillus rhizoplanae]